jgi:hypothetical protein
MGDRALRSNRLAWARHGAPLLLVFYLAWILSPLLHQILETRGQPCQHCPAEEPGWRILSHPPEEPCSDPDHHHHPRPSHDEDYCLSCRLCSAVAGVLPFVGAPIQSVQATRSAVAQVVLAPLPPELLTMSPRAPPPLPSA